MAADLDQLAIWALRVGRPGTAPPVAPPLLIPLLATPPRADCRHSLAADDLCGRMSAVMWHVCTCVYVRVR